MSERTRTALVNLLVGLVIVAGMGAAIWALLQNKNLVLNQFATVVSLAVELM